MKEKKKSVSSTVTRCLSATSPNTPPHTHTLFDGPLTEAGWVLSQVLRKKTRQIQTFFFLNRGGEGWWMGVCSLPLRSFARLHHREEAGYYTKGGTIQPTDRPENTSFVRLVDALGLRGGTCVHDGWFYKPRVPCISLV